MARSDKVNESNTLTMVKALDANTAAALRHEVTLTEVAEKVDAVTEWVHRHTPVQGIPVTMPDADTPSERRKRAGGLYYQNGHNKGKRG